MHIKFYKKISSTLIFLLTVLLIISSVNAIEENNNDTTVIEETNIQTSDISVSEANAENIDNSKSTQDNTLKASNNNRYFNSSAENDGDGSAENPWKTITSEHLNSISQGTVYIANGNYEINQYITINSDITIIGENINDTIISLKNDYYLRVSLSKTVNMANLTIRNGNNKALRNSGTLTLDHVKFENNKGYDGGAIDNDRTLNINNSYFYNNKATEYGSAIYNKETLNVNNTVFADNSAKWGTIYTITHMSIINCTFLNDYATYGGAIYMEKLRGNPVTIKSSRFINCTSYSYGGAIASYNSTSTIINDNEFINCKSIRSTGGAAYFDNANSTLTNNTFINNSAIIGGAYITLNSFTNLTGNIFENNTAKYYGGAIFDSYNDIKIDNNTFRNNSAQYGGAIYILSIQEYLNITQSIFESNTAVKSGGAIYSDGNTINLINNQFKDNYAQNKLDLYHDHSFKLNLVNNTWSASRNNITVETSNIAKTLVNITNLTINVNDPLPSYYDLREHEVNITVKNQANGGSCWSFTSLESLESSILLNTGIYYDLSENNQKNIMALYSKDGYHIFPNDGGYNSMFLGYLTGWLGPVLEVNDTYDDYDTVSPLLDSIVRVQDVYGVYRSNKTDNDDVKRAIMKYGAIYTSMMYDDSYRNKDTNGYYYIGGGANHAVTVVGWNDTYSRYRFKPSTPAPGDGAWIVKNSWGDDWGDKGYFYVSYYDSMFLRTSTNTSDFPESFVVILNSSKNYDKNYQYDVSGFSDWANVTGSTVSYYNNYVAEDDEIIKAFGTYVHHVGTRYTAEVYVNEEKQYTQNGTFDFAGFETISLNQDVAVSKGDSFKVVLTITNPYGSITYYPIASDDDYRLFTSRNNSFVIDRYDVKTDLSTLNQTASLKVYTNVVPKTNTVMNLVTTYDEVTNQGIVTINLKDENGNPITTGTVRIYKENDLVKTLDVTDGTVTVDDILMTNGLHNLTIDYDDESKTFKSISQELSVKVRPKIIDTHIEDLVYVQDTTPIKEISITGTVYDKDDNYVRIGKVVLYENDLILGDYNITEGIFNITYKFDELGVHNLSVVYVDDYEIYETSQWDNIIINVHRVEAVIQELNVTPSSISGGEIIEAKTFVTDQYGNPIENGRLYYMLNGENLLNNNRLITTVITNGVSVLDYKMPATLTEDEYTLSAVLISTNYYNSTSKDFTFQLSKKDVFINVDYPDNVTLIDDVNIIVNVDDNYGNTISQGQVNVFDDLGKINTIPVNGTSIIINPAFNKTGLHNISITYEDPGEQYNTNTRTIQIQVNKADANITQLTVTPDTITSADTITITARITDKNGNNINEGNITYQINGQTITSNITNGISTINHTMPENLDEETYTITANYTGTQTYNPTNKNTTITRTTQTPTININLQNNTKIYDNITITATITNTNEKTINKGQANIYYDNTLIKTVNLSQEQINIKHTNNQTGTHTIKIEYNDPTGQYQTTTQNKTIEVKQLNTNISQITINPTNITSSDTISITTTVTDENGNNVKDGYLVYKLSGQTLKNNSTTITGTVIDGRAAINYTLPAGQSGKTYTLTVKYTSSSDNYNTTTSDTNITVNKSPININITNTRIEDNKIIVNATLTDKNGNLLVGTNTYSFKISGLTLKDDTGKTVTIKGNNGKLDAQINLPSTLQTMKGTKQLTIITGERNAYLSLKTTTDLNIKPTATQIEKITITPTKVTGGDTITITTIVNKENGKPVTIGYVYYKLNGQSIKINNTPVQTTINNGTATFTYTLPAGLSSKNYTISAYYYGYEQYLTSNANTTIFIEKSETIMQIINTKIEDNKIYINATLKDKNGNLLVGTNKISLKINDMTLKDDQQKTIILESKNGILNTVINLPKSLQTAKSIKNITITTGARNAYQSGSTTSSIKVYTTNTTIKDITISPSKVTAGQTITVTTSISKENGEPVPLGYVYYKLSGITLKENNTQIQTAVINGTTTLTYTLRNNMAPGNYTLTIKYYGYSQYTASTKDAIIKLE